MSVTKQISRFLFFLSFMFFRTFVWAQTLIDPQYKIDSNQSMIFVDKKEEWFFNHFIKQRILGFAILCIFFYIFLTTIKRYTITKRISRILIHEIMNHQPYTLAPQNYLSPAIDLFAKEGIRHIPVIGDIRNLLGMITRQDIDDFVSLRKGKLAISQDDPIFSNYKIEELMTSPALFLGPYDTIDKAISLMVKNKIGAIAVTDVENRLIGLVTRTDIMNGIVKYIIDNKKEKSKLETA
ncbi:MAG: CBS domain-containing protein [Candidatus Omnitrophica bacterium]|nr:CBS domain-containing protein [Candidatus Omnitrophota bacterium]